MKDFEIKVGDKVRFEYENWDEDKVRQVNGIGIVKEIDTHGDDDDLENSTVYVQTTRVYHFMDYGAIREVLIPQPPK